ncbi:MAG: helix-turn-helix domain-containing protein, partial [Deltaproteobacteria bacterium]|nr:helix-turn-helix domain-containing protein [Deltaproteobacteria bacterium]
MKLTIKEVARSLDLPSNTLERWVRQGRIPMRRTGNTCMFKKSVLEKWAKNH